MTASTSPTCRLPGKVVFVNRYGWPDLSATSQMVGGLAFALARQGISVDLVTSRQLYGQPQAKLKRYEEVDNLRIHRIGTSAFGRGNLVGRAADYATFHVAAMMKAAKLLAPGDLVIACTDPPLLSTSVGISARLRGAGLINWLQDIFPETATALGVMREEGPHARLLRALRDRSLFQARMNVALGSRMAEWLETRGVPPNRIRVIHNFPDDDIHPLAPEGNPLRREWGLEGQLVVGYSGNLGRAHEFETILAAAEIMRDRQDITFLFVGGGHHRPWVEREVALRALGNVAFRPLQPQDRLAESLAVADIHLISLRPEVEGLIVPSKFYGIAAARRPILFVGDRQGEIARLLAQHDCGATVMVGDGAGLAQSILRLHADAPLRQRWGANAQAACDERFRRQAAVSAWLDVLTPSPAPVPASSLLAEAK